MSTILVRQVISSTDDVWRRLTSTAWGVTGTFMESGGYDTNNWQKISFSDFYAAGVTFNKNDKAISTVDGLTYISGIDTNKGNEKSVNLDKWALDRPALPYVSGKTYSTGETAISIVDKCMYVSQSAHAGNEPSETPSQCVPIHGPVT